MTTPIHVVHTIASLGLRGGGTSRVAVEYTDALARQSAIDVILLTQSSNSDDLVVSQGECVRRVVAASDNRVALRAGMPFKVALRRLIAPGVINLLHSHGLWLPVNHWASQAARVKSIPLIVQPHGMLEPWALNYKAWKKRIAMILFQRRDLETAKTLVATSSNEYENIRKLGFRQPIALIPNGVKFDEAKDGNLQQPDHDTDTRIVLFLSRIHPIKGLINLVRAWTQLALQGWRLRIAGPDEGGHLQEIMALVRELGIDNVVEYVGEVDSERKLAEYCSADLFVLPTYSENFGVVVAEALAHGVPVITTRGAPWADLETFGCGWWVDIGVEPLVQALRDAIALSDDERREMGARGREYVRRYDWDTIAQQTIEVYRWVLGQGAKPDCVLTD